MMRFFKFGVLLVSVPFMGAISQESVFASEDAADCREFMVPGRTIEARQVGQQDCRLLEATVKQGGRTYRRVEVGISGTVFAYAVKEGPRAAYFTSVPEFIFPKRGQSRLCPFSVESRLKNRSVLVEHSLNLLQIRSLCQSELQEDSSLVGQQVVS